MTTWTSNSPSGGAEPPPRTHRTPGRGTPPDDDLRTAVADFNWLLNRFATETAGVVDAIGVSSDGLLIAVSRPGAKGDSERLAAIVSGLTSLAMGASGNYGLGSLNKVIIDLESGNLLVSTIGAGAVLGVVTSKEAKLGNIAYEMTLFANRAGAALSPELIMELKKAVDTSASG